jgi:hypothetical protein
MNRRESAESAKSATTVCAPAGGECLKRDAVGGPRDGGSAEDDEQTLSDPHGNDHGKEPEREPVAAIDIVDARRKELVEHAFLS